MCHERCNRGNGELKNVYKEKYSLKQFPMLW